MLWSTGACEFALDVSYDSHTRIRLFIICVHQHQPDTFLWTAKVA